MFQSRAGWFLLMLISLLWIRATTGAQESFYREAPMLAERVAVGDLPPVDERLPQNPLLVTPDENVGTYGGTWNMAMVQQDNFFLHRTLGYENLLRWDAKWIRWVPNVAQAIETSDDSKTFTIQLREGMRWSDGQPFTSADILFWYEAAYLNPEVTKLLPDILVIGSGLTVSIQGDYEVVFQFEQPNGLFLQRLASSLGGRITHMPRHYLQQFHADYNPNVDQLVVEAGLSTWADLFAQKVEPQSPNRPSLFAWVVESYTNEVIHAVRNPYYWKIDTTFGQLPYIDAVEFTIVETRDDMLPLVSAGKIDMQDRNLPIAVTQTIPLEGYRLYELLPAYSNYMAIAFNLTHVDPAKRQIFQNRDFRIGLSYAINRPAIIEASGLDVQPRQVAPLEGTLFYNEQMANQYLEYDVALANEYLDLAGYSNRDANGYRLGPDDKPIRLTFLLANPVVGANYDLHLAMIQADWRAVGVDLQIEMLPRAEAETRWINNDFDVSAWVGEGGYDAILEPRYYVPTNAFWTQYGILWARWYIDPLDTRAEEPPPAVQANISLYRKILQTADFEQQNLLMSEIVATAATEFLAIGIHEMPSAYGIVRPSFHNVPEQMFFATNYLNPGPTNPAQYYIDPQDD